MKSGVFNLSDNPDGRSKTLHHLFHINYFPWPDRHHMTDITAIKNVLDQSHEN